MQKNVIVIFVIKYANYRSKCIFKSENLDRQKNQPELSNLVFICSIFSILYKHTFIMFIHFCSFIYIYIFISQFIVIANILLQCIFLKMG